MRALLNFKDKIRLNCMACGEVLPGIVKQRKAGEEWLVRE